MARKTGLGDNLPWIIDTTKKVRPGPKPTRTTEVKKSSTSGVRKSRDSEVPKFKTFEVKLSTLLREDQLNFLEKLTRDIMASRDSNNKRERITKNSVIRTYIDALKNLDIHINNIPDEETLLQRIKKGLANLRNSEVRDFLS